ncbi:hypothetical protein [Sulfobacillus thermosulfidooxidans]|uniref:hypothetical protein n=1 Tax=Sulfobacillus thermosulfidooxidans TaxID=28034 RepID=UPI0006B61987|nr:hypothetical protein [Sulfobacillus thermosulfidooxidans]
MKQNLFEHLEAVRRGFDLHSRVSVTQLGRSTQWRADLNKFSVLEVLDRNQTTAILLKPEVYQAIKTYLDQLEEELEQARVDALFAQRDALQHWASGDDLAQQALASFTKRHDHLRNVLDNHDQ